jgi:hypothetical protein
MTDVSCLTCWPLGGQEHRGLERSRVAVAGWSKNYNEERPHQGRGLNPVNPTNARIRRGERFS